MKLERAKKALVKLLSETNISFEYEIEDGGLFAKAKSVKLGDLDDDILIIISVYENDAVAIEFIFDKVTNRATTLELINEINRVSAWMNAYIDSKGFFVCHHSIISVFDEDALVDAVSFILNYVADDKFINLIRPISLLTEQ